MSRPWGQVGPCPQSHLSQEGFCVQPSPQPKSQGVRAPKLLPQWWNTSPLSSALKCEFLATMSHGSKCWMWLGQCPGTLSVVTAKFYAPMGGNIAMGKPSHASLREHFGDKNNKKKLEKKKALHPHPLFAREEMIAQCEQRRA